MKFFGLILSAAVALGLTGCAHSEEHDHDHTHSHSASSSHDHDHEGHAHDDDEHAEGTEDAHQPGEIVVEPEIAARFGVRVDTVRRGVSTETVKAAGVFLSSSADMAVVSAPIAGRVAYNSGVTVGASLNRGASVGRVVAGQSEGAGSNAVAKATMEAAKREVDRLRPLYEQQLITADVYNQALAAYEAARAAYAPAATGALSSPVGGIVTEILVPNGQIVEPGTPLLTVAGNSVLTLRVDVPRSRYNLVQHATNANIVVPGTNTAISLAEAGGRRLSDAPAGTTSPSGFMPLYFNVPAHGITAGTTAEVYLIVPRMGNNSSMIAVPRTALVENQGSYSVYVSSGDHTYKRIPVTIAGSDGVNTLITSGLSGNELIVVEGTTTVRLAENSGAIPEGHNHNH